MYELWFRAPYEEDLKLHAFTSALRPGNRNWGNHKGTRIGDTVKLRVLEMPGADDPYAEPSFREFEALARITGLQLFKIGELTRQHLADCSPDVREPAMVKYHLGLIYNRMFADDEEVTLVSWKYL